MRERGLLTTNSFLSLVYPHISWRIGERERERKKKAIALPACLSLLVCQITDVLMKILGQKQL
jgi:hypothetical protein